MPSIHRPDLLAVERATDPAVVKLTGNRLDESNVEVVGEQLLRLAESLGSPQLHLDLDHLEFVSSVGLGKFVALHGKIRRAGGQLRLVNVRDSVYELFEMTRLDQLLDVQRKEAV